MPVFTHIAVKCAIDASLNKNPSTTSGHNADFPRTLSSDCDVGERFEHGLDEEQIKCSAALTTGVWNHRQYSCDGNYSGRKCADTIGTVPIPSAGHFQCKKIPTYFSDKIYRSNFIKHHSETVMVWNYPNAECSLRKKIIVSFIIIFGTLSFPVSAAT